MNSYPLGASTYIVLKPDENRTRETILPQFLQHFGVVNGVESLRNVDKNNVSFQSLVQVLSNIPINKKSFIMVSILVVMNAISNIQIHINPSRKDLVHNVWHCELTLIKL